MKTFKSFKKAGVLPVISTETQTPHPKRRRPLRDTTRRIATNNAQPRPTFTAFAGIQTIPSRGRGSLRTIDRRTRDIRRRSSMPAQTKTPPAGRRSLTGGVSGILTRRVPGMRRLWALV